MKGCDNCYYEYFDEKAYPCSLCIRGIKRTDKWMPSKKTKAEIQTETSTNSEKVQLTDEPQTGVIVCPIIEDDADYYEWLYADDIKRMKEERSEHE